MRAEGKMRQMRASVITRTVDAYRTATTGDVTESMHQQLCLMVEWAKQFEQFSCLTMPVKSTSLYAALKEAFFGENRIVAELLGTTSR